jgi:hypothetical protein
MPVNKPRFVPDFEWARKAAVRGDLSRNDWLLLYETCRDQSVVEVGSGGSTLMLASITSRLVSYETDRAWYLSVRKELKNHGIGHVDLRKIEAKPDALAPTADVYVIDCDSRHQLRSRWIEFVESHRLAPLVLVHDSRRQSPVNDLDWLFRWPRNARLETALFHEADSNFLVLRFRDDPVRYEDWYREPNRKPLKLI